MKTIITILCGIIEIYVAWKIGGLNGAIIGKIIGTIIEKIVNFLIKKYHRKSNKKKQQTNTTIINYYSIHIKY